MLGEFGEVLVMDWGLAMPTADFRKSRNVTPPVSMGGTPAYMAPEMALGPIERIGFASDVYLLGAMLYEIITGQPPHTGKDVTTCLMSASKNKVAPTEKKGELVDIALKAMASESRRPPRLGPRFPERHSRLSVPRREHRLGRPSRRRTGRRRRRPTTIKTLLRPCLGFRKPCSCGT